MGLGGSILVVCFIFNLKGIIFVIVWKFVYIKFIVFGNFCLKKKKKLSGDIKEVWYRGSKKI